MLAPLRVIRDVLLDWWYGWFNLIILSTLWMLACLTIVLAPPATFALFYVAHDLARGQDVGAGDFVSRLRRYFLISWLWALINIVIALLFWLDFRFYGSTSASWAGALLVFSVMLATFWILSQIFTLAFYMMYEQPRLRTAFRSAAFMLFASPFYSVIMAAFIGLLIFASTQVVILPFLGTPMLIALSASRSIRERLRTFKLLSDDELPGNDESALNSADR